MEFIIYSIFQDKIENRANIFRFVLLSQNQIWHIFWYLLLNISYDILRVNLLRSFQLFPSSNKSYISSYHIFSLEPCFNNLLKPLCIMGLFWIIGHWYLQYFRMIQLLILQFDLILQFWFYLYYLIHFILMQSSDFVPRLYCPHNQALSWSQNYKAIFLF